MTRKISSIGKRIALCGLFIVFIAQMSCTKADYENDLAGQWQLYEWTTTSGQFSGGIELGIYYSFQLQMMMFQKSSASSNYMLASYQYNDSTIYVYNPIKYNGNGHDEILKMDTLAQYGVPHSGLFNVVRLSSKKLILYSNETGQLKFRKY